MKPTISILLLLACMASGQWLEKVVYLPDSLSRVLWPSSIASNPEFHKIYVSGDYEGCIPNCGDLSILVLDSRTGGKLARIAVQSRVSALAYSSVTDKLYAAHSGLITVIDGATDAVIGTIVSDPNRARLCCNTVNGKVYRASEVVESLSIIDGAGDTVIAKVRMPGDELTLEFDSTGNKLYCGYSAPGVLGLLVIDGDGDTVLADIPLSFTPTSAVASRQHRKLYCCGQSTDGCELAVVDTDRDTVLAVLPGGGINEQALCIDERRDELFFRAPGDTILALDCSSDTVNRRLAAFPGRSVGTLRCLPDRGLLFCRVSLSVFVLNVETGDTVTSLPTGYDPEVFLMDQAEARLYCVNRVDNDVTVYDASADSLVRSEILVGSSPTEIRYAARANKIYAADGARGSVYAIDCATGRVNTIRLPGKTVRALCYDSLDDKMYCAANEDSVHVIDCATDSVVAAIRTGWHPLSLSYSPRQNRVYSVNSNSSSITVIDCNTDRVIVTVPVNSPREGCPLFYNPVRDEIFSAMQLNDGFGIDVIDCGTSRLIGSLPYVPFCIVYHRTLGKIYLMCGPDPSAVVLDAASDSMVTTIQGARGFDGGVNEEDGKVYSVSRGNARFVVIVNAEEDTVVSLITSIPAPMTAAHDVLNDKMYVPSGEDDGRVFVLDGPTDSIVDSIGVRGHRPHDAMWEPRQGRVYISNAYSGSVSVVRDSTVPGIQDVVAVPLRRGGGTLVRQLSLPAGARQARVFDTSGRKVAELHPGANDVRRLAPGVYFIREGRGAGDSGQGQVRKVVIAR